MGRKSITKTQLFTTFTLRLSVLLLLSSLPLSCSYRRAVPSTNLSSSSVFISPIQGDDSGIMTQTVIAHIARYTPLSIATQYGARYQLDIAITDKDTKHIGYRYDIEDMNEPTDDRTVPVESRRTILARVQLYDNNCQECVFGPDYLKVAVEYDHDHNLSDASRKSLSMGQLASYGNSLDFIEEPLGKELAEAVTLYLNQNL